MHTRQLAENVHHSGMTAHIDVTPTDEQLADLFPGTLHTRWGQAGGPGGIGANGDDFVCRCDFCAKVRRDRWEKEPG